MGSPPWMCRYAKARPGSTVRQFLQAISVGDHGGDLRSERPQNSLIARKVPYDYAAPVMCCEPRTLVAEGRALSRVLDACGLRFPHPLRLALAAEAPLPTRPCHLLPPAHLLLFCLGEAREQVRRGGFHALIANGIAARNHDQLGTHRQALCEVEIAAEGAVWCRPASRSSTSSRYHFHHPFVIRWNRWREGRVASANAPPKAFPAAKSPPPPTPQAWPPFSSAQSVGAFRR
jgi:hypothetical protein